jgi:hypothetical protein
MNGLCGQSTSSVITAAAVQDRGQSSSPSRRHGSGIIGVGGSGSISGASSGIGPIGGGNIIGGSAVGAVGCPTGMDAVRKSRSQGGKKLQKCLSTASYGEEFSISRPQMTPLSHNLLMTRQYCSFGSTTRPYSNKKKPLFLYLTLPLFNYAL